MVWVSDMQKEQRINWQRVPWIGNRNLGGNRPRQHSMVESELFWGLIWTNAKDHAIGHHPCLSHVNPLRDLSERARPIFWSLESSISVPRRQNLGARCLRGCHKRIPKRIDALLLLTTFCKDSLVSLLERLQVIWPWRRGWYQILCWNGQWTDHEGIKQHYELNLSHYSKWNCCQSFQISRKVLEKAHHDWTKLSLIRQNYDHGVFQYRYSDSYHQYDSFWKLFQPGIG